MMVMLFVVRAAVVVSSLPFPSLPPLPPDQGAPVGIGVTERGSLAVQPAPNTDVVHHRGLLARRPRFEATAAKVSRVSRIRREVVEAPGCGSSERTAWRTRAHTSPSGPGRCGAKAPARIRASPSPPTWIGTTIGGARGTSRCPAASRSNRPASSARGPGTTRSTRPPDGAARTTGTDEGSFLWPLLL